MEMLMLIYVIGFVATFCLYWVINPQVTGMQLSGIALGFPFLISYTIYYSFLCPLFFNIKGLPVITVYTDKDSDIKDTKSEQKNKEE